IRALWSQLMATRYDSGTLGKAERTPQGGLRVPARLTRIGILEYRRSDGSIRRELRPPDEVFKPDSLATLKGAPVTNLHPGLVTSKNYRALSVGHVSEDVREDGQYVAATAYVQDGQMVELVESGKRREVSLGYMCRMDETPGEWRGERYDAVQRDIQYNHAGLGPRGWGRAGSEGSLRLDGSGDEIPPTGDDADEPRDEAPEETMADKTIERLDGVEYEVGTEAHRSAVARRESDAKASAEKLAKLEARADAAEEKIKGLEKAKADLE